MAGQRTLPGIGLVSYWELSDDSYKPDMDANFAKLSILVQARALSRTTALPGTPQPNAIYIVPANASANAGKIAYVDNGAYVYLTPAPGMRVFVTDTGTFTYWNGTAWTDEASTSTPSTLGLSDTPDEYGEPGQVLAVSPTGDALIWIDAGLPLGGAEGQVLARGPDNTLVWIDPPEGGGGGIEEAPLDGKQYARQDGAWVEVPEPAAAPDLSAFIDSTQIDHAVYLTQAAYDALATKDARTLYLIPVA